MNLPVSTPNQRCTAEIAMCVDARLEVPALRHRVDLVHCGSRLGAPLAHLDHTPSPLGQQGAYPALLSSFSGAMVLGEVKKSSAPHHGRNVLVCGVDPSRQGIKTCPSHASQPQSCYAPVLPLAATRLPSRALAGRPLAQGPQLSPVAALRRGPRSARQAISPIAISIPENVANTALRNNFAARPARCTRSQRPAQQSLLQGFCVSLKTQKDTPCSRKF